MRIPYFALRFSRPARLPGASREASWRRNNPPRVGVTKQPHDGVLSVISSSDKERPRLETGDDEGIQPGLQLCYFRKYLSISCHLSRSFLENAEKVLVEDGVHHSAASVVRTGTVESLESTLRQPDVQASSVVVVSVWLRD